MRFMKLNEWVIFIKESCRINEFSFDQKWWMKGIVLFLCLCQSFADTAMCKKQYIFIEIIYHDFFYFKYYTQLSKCAFFATTPFSEDLDNPKLFIYLIHFHNSSEISSWWNYMPLYLITTLQRRLNVRLLQSGKWVVI